MKIMKNNRAILCLASDYQLKPIANSVKNSSLHNKSARNTGAKTQLLKNVNKMLLYQ